MRTLGRGLLELLFLLGLAAYPVMIALGALHGDIPEVPALGYWTVFLAGLAARVAYNVITLKVQKVAPKK